jgi:predicted CXXCH cytochrome family protein
MRKKWFPWLGWTAVSATMAALLIAKWRSDDRTVFLPGSTSHGHYQLELRCDACHTPWNGVKENACYNCHSTELKLANDSHSKSKFTDPRNADRLKAIDASNCITCHREHVPEQTRAMGVTVPNDVCFHCHQQTLQDRPSHKDFPFDSCATAGCHNYHDNTALYEDFLRKHLNQPDEHDNPHVARRSLFTRLEDVNGYKKKEPLQLEDHNAPEPPEQKVLKEWASTAHAQQGVNCADCHTTKNRGAKSRHWSDSVAHTACAECHQAETDGFLGGKHGMRLAQGLSPLRPGFARPPMKAAASERELTCASCHGAHEFDPRPAAVDACLQCHDDAHSRAYENSPHFALWKLELAGEAKPGTGVSCATCHMPRLEKPIDGATHIFVEHNQNANLRPNE